MVNTLQPLQLGVLVGDQDGPVEDGLALHPAIASRILEVVPKMGAVDKELLGHTAAHYASAAGAQVFDDCDSLAVPAGSHPRRAHATRAGANSN